LRNRINIHVFTVDQIRVREDRTLTPTTIVIDTTSPASSRTADYPLTDLHRLTLVCRQFYSETKRLPYTLNTFSLTLWSLRSMISRSPQLMRTSVKSLLVHTGGFEAGKDEQAFLRQMEQMDVLIDMPLVAQVAVMTFHKIQLSERSLRWATAMAKDLTGRDIEFVNFKEPVVVE
jgi:hypothetical protein